VAAHWRYKEGGAALSLRAQDQSARSLWHRPEGGDTSRDFLDRMRVDLFQDRIYVISPRVNSGCPVGGTPLDFAYQVHTTWVIVHSRAKVNGRMVPLELRAQEQRNGGDHHAKAAQPSRDWLSPVGVSRESQAPQ